MREKNIYVFGEAKETCLVNPLPSGVRLRWPIHARDRKTLDMYAMLEKKKNHHPFFSGDIKRCALQQNASECEGSIYDFICFVS